MSFTEFGQLGDPFRTEDPRHVYFERTFKEAVYFEKDVIFSSGESAQAKARSANFSVTDETGWGMDGAGNAWFYGTTTLGGSTVILADLYSSDWDGTNPANLATRDSGATKGYYLDHSAGAAQFVKLYADTGELRDMDIRGNITLGSSGVFRTAASGQRVQIDSNDFDRIQFFSGGSKESSTPSRITSGADASGYPSLSIWGPVDTDAGNDINTFYMNSAGASSYGIDVTSIYQKIRLDSRGNGAGGTGIIEMAIGGGEIFEVKSDGIEMNATADIQATKDGDTDRSLVGNFGGIMYNASGTNQNVAHNTVTIVTLDTDFVDDGHNNLANNRFDVPVTGWYAVTGHVRWNAVGGGIVGIRIYQNGILQDYVSVTAAAGGGSYQSISTILKATAGDYIDVRVIQTSGVTVSLNTGSVFESSLRVAALF